MDSTLFDKRMAQQSNKSSHWPHYRPIAPAIRVPPSSLSPALKSSLERVDGSALDKSSDTLSVGSFTGSLSMCSTNFAVYNPDHVSLC